MIQVNSGTCQAFSAIYLNYFNACGDLTAHKFIGRQFRQDFRHFRGGLQILLAIIAVLSSRFISLINMLQHAAPKPLGIHNSLLPDIRRLISGRRKIHL